MCTGLTEDTKLYIRGLFFLRSLQSIRRLSKKEKNCFASGKMEWTYFSLFFPLSTTKNTGHYVQNKYETLRDGEEGADWLGILKHKE